MGVRGGGVVTRLGGVCMKGGARGGGGGGEGEEMRRKRKEGVRKVIRRGKGRVREKRCRGERKRGLGRGEGREIGGEG